MSVPIPGHNYEVDIINGSADNAVAINLSADTTLTAQTRALLATAAGVVKVDMAESGTAVVLPIAAGVPLAVAVTKVYSTANGTSATGIVALW